MTRDSAVSMSWPLLKRASGGFRPTTLTSFRFTAGTR